MPQSSQNKTRRGRPAQPLDQRILRLTDRSGDCWLWLGYRDRKDYGRITVNKRSRAAHRVSYETFVGPIPEGLEIDHLCRVQRCVNPKHLEAVTHLVNLQRAMEATGMVAGKQLGGRQLGDLCSEGHLLDAENVTQARGLNYCLTCRREQNRLAASGGKPRQRSYTDHVKVAAKLRETPNTWCLVATYSAKGSAAHTASHIRLGKRLVGYQPAGAFEARIEKEPGTFRVVARYVDTHTSGATS